MGLNRNRIMIRNPFSFNAVSIAVKTGYLVINLVLILSRNKYRPSKNDNIAPIDAPMKVAIVPNNTPVHKLDVDAVKTNPAPNVRIDPGIKNMVQTTYTNTNANTP